MGPLTRAAYLGSNDVRRVEIASAMHVTVPTSMLERCVAISRTFPDETPWTGRLPHDTVCVETEETAWIIRDVGDSIEISYLSQKGVTMFGAFDKRSRNYRVNVSLVRPGGYRDREHLDSSALAVIMALDLLFEFMVEPRFVVQSPAPDFRRRHVARTLGVPALPGIWISLAWTIGSSTRAKKDRAGSAPVMPFHMVKAHWRKYDRQTAKAERIPGRPGWFVWIESHYSGNPALGTVGHHYSPKIDDPGKSSATMNEIIAAKISQGLDARKESE